MDYEILEKKLCRFFSTSFLLGLISVLYVGRCWVSAVEK
jgi:hypothetical protein